MSDEINYDKLLEWEPLLLYECPYGDCGYHMEESEMIPLHGTYVVKCPMCGKISKYYKVP